MTGVPIDEAALELAVKALIVPYGGSRSELDEPAARACVSTYLGAVGAKVENAAATSISPASQRLVTPWKPLTDTEEER